MAGFSSSYSTSMRRTAVAGLVALIIFGGTIGIWAAASSLTGAVMAPGMFIADSNVKKIQHPQGGVVAELPVKDGDFVRMGDLVLRLDETVSRANLQIVARQIDEFSVRRARLVAELAGAPQMTIPAELEQRRQLPELDRSIAEEQRLMETRRQQREGQKQQLTQRIVQLREEIGGINAQIASRDAQIKLLDSELDSLRDLFRRNLVPLTRIMPVEREAANMLGQRGQLVAQRAQAEGRISEVNLQLLQVEIEMQTEAGRELRDVQARLVELQERRVAADDLLKRVELRSPIDGYVHQLAVHTVGGVVSPAEPAMLIIPANDELQIEARVAPTDIDQLHLKQRAILRVLAGNQRTTPEIAGELSRIAADVTREQQTGLTYYLVRITVPPAELARLGSLRIISGMQAEAFIQTGQRSPLEYLMRPLQDQFNRAFRER